MSLSITNPDHISEQEISSLANVNLNYQLIALDKSAEGGPKLVVLSKDNVSCWVMFLRMFGWGALGNMDVHLKDISAYLNQFNWQEGANKPGNSNYYQAYLKTCMIANKAALYKGDNALLTNVSTASLEKSLDFTQFQDGKVLFHHDVQYSLQWNPAMQYKHIQGLIQRQFPRCRVDIRDQHQHVISPNTNVSPENYANAKIYIYHHLETPQPCRQEQPRVRQVNQPHHRPHNQPIQQFPAAFHRYNQQHYNF
ncbi:MAG: hypothetical protein JSR93_00470 [Verrucomicrobia bacterium]|nr:hypothetical protein [Verrucomicrobiota bacterium]